MKLPQGFIFLSLPLFSFVISSRTATAAEQGFDAFDAYTVGASLNGAAAGTGWTDAWFAEAPVTVAEKTLTFGGKSGGATSALIGGTDFLHMMSRPFASVSDTLYLGMLLRTENWDDDFMQLQVSNGATGNDAATMTVGLDGRDPIGFYSRIGTSGQGSSFSSGATHAVDTDYFLVGKFSKDGGSSTYNRVDLFVNPAGTTEPAVADATREGIDSTLSELSLFTVRTALMEGPEMIYLDDVRVATSFADVAVPEPSSITLAVWAMAGVIGIRRRSQRRRGPAA